MSAHGHTAPAPPVLTHAGREWLHDRLERARERRARVEEELSIERDERLLEERRQLDAQISELEALLEEAVAPGETRDDPSIVEVGDEVQVEMPDGTLESFLIVHPQEAGMDEHRTSAGSPIAQAVLGQRPGDRVTVRTPAGVYGCTIVRRDRLE